MLLNLPGQHLHKFWYTLEADMRIAFKYCSMFWQCVALVRRKTALMKQGLSLVACASRSDGLQLLGSHVVLWELIPQSFCLVLLWGM